MLGVKLSFNSVFGQAFGIDSHVSVLSGLYIIINNNNNNNNNDNSNNKSVS